MNTHIFAAVIALTFLFQIHFSKADVLIESGSIDRFEAAGVPGMNQLTFMSGNGQAGDFFLFTCIANTSIGMNSFNNPAPDIFTERQAGQCGPNTCVEGIWTGFTDSAGSVDISCNTTGASILIATGLLRYSNVDPVDPVIAVSCEQGTSNTATAPSINTEAGSQVVRIYHSSTFNDATVNEVDVTAQAASFSSEATIESFMVSTIGDSSLFMSGGPTGTAIQQYPEFSRDWTACTIGLRMLPVQPTDPPPTNPPPTLIPPPTPPPTRSIPALSVWGNITIALLAVLFGAWYLRRKKLKS